MKRLEKNACHDGLCGGHTERHYDVTSILMHEHEGNPVIN